MATLPFCIDPDLLATLSNLPFDMSEYLHDFSSEIGQPSVLLDPTSSTSGSEIPDTSVLTFAAAEDVATAAIWDGYVDKLNSGAVLAYGNTGDYYIPSYEESPVPEDTDEGGPGSDIVESSTSTSVTAWEAGGVVDRKVPCGGCFRAVGKPTCRGVPGSPCIRCKKNNKGCRPAGKSRWEDFWRDPWD